MAGHAYAHTVPGQPQDAWEPLEAHLRLVATGSGDFPGAAGFAAAFGAEACGRILGLWHDLGKYSVAFQNYLKSSEGAGAHLKDVPARVDHSTVGAQHAVQRCKGVGRLLAYCIAGHHGGLPDAVDRNGGDSGLDARLKKKVQTIHGAPAQILEEACPPFPSLTFMPDMRYRAFQAAMFCRMLFSCLVDADFLATERFVRSEQAVARQCAEPSLTALAATLDTCLQRLAAAASDTLVNRKRAEVLRACLRAAKSEPGLFSLTVPTGGGKTLSSLAFALSHAVRHGMRRVVYSIPFTSIIEQNVDVFRGALASSTAEVVLEHHSNLDPEKESLWSRLAAENWDATIVVTTNVQLFESLFAVRPSRCRKLHRLSRSVIILDEAQTLPVDLLRPSLAALEELCRNYGCSVVLCSATQPAVSFRDDFPIGLKNVREIIPNVPELFDTLKRVQVQSLGRLTNAELVDRLTKEEQVLCVVNTRGHAAEVYRLLASMAGGGCYHLSAQMCPRHRSAVLRLIRRKLRRGEACRVVSTQLVEAGVDVDFPVVYRAMAGLDSVAQAAGRCNREGRLHLGRVFVFEPETQLHAAAQAAQDTREVMAGHSDLLSPEAIEEFFQLHYWKRKDLWDAYRIMNCFDKGGSHLQFREAAEAYRLIRYQESPVIVPYGYRGKRLVRELEALPEPPGRRFDRRAQRYVVGLHPRQYQRLLANQAVVECHERFWILKNIASYDRNLGLRLDQYGFDPEELMV